MRQGRGIRELYSQNCKIERNILMLKPQKKTGLLTPQRVDWFERHTLALASSSGSVCWLLCGW